MEVGFLIRPHQGRVPQSNEKCVYKMGAQTQHKARQQVGRPNATQGTSGSWAHQRNAGKFRKLGAPMPVRNANARHVRTSASWAPQRNARWSTKRKTHPQRKRAQKGALGQKTSWRMDKNKFWLGGIIFNTTSPRLGAPPQHKARPQVGRPNARPCFVLW